MRLTKSGLVYSTTQRRLRTSAWLARNHDEIARLRQQGHAYAKIAPRFGVSPPLLARYCKDKGIVKPTVPTSRRDVRPVRAVTEREHAQLIRYAEVIRRRDKHETHAAIGAALGVSKERIRQIERKARRWGIGTFDNQIV